MKVNIGISVEEDQAKEWKEAAKKKDMSLSAFVRRAVETYMILIRKQENSKK
jgi:hypothetical protein